MTVLRKTNLMLRQEERHKIEMNGEGLSSLEGPAAFCRILIINNYHNVDAVCSAVVLLFEIHHRQQTNVFSDQYLLRKDARSIRNAAHRKCTWSEV